MRGQWESSIRRLNRHYQSAIPPFEPPVKAIYHDNMVIRWSAFELITDWNGTPVDISVTAIGPNWNDTQQTSFWGWGSKITDIELPATIIGSSNSIEYRGTYNDYIDAQTVYGDLPNYETPYFGGSKDPSNLIFYINGGASRLANSNLELTIETSITVYITYEKVKTDQYHAAGARNTYTLTTGTDIRHGIMAEFYLIDVDDTTNFMYIHMNDVYDFQTPLDDHITKTAYVLNANSWTQNRVPNRYKVCFNGGAITAQPAGTDPRYPDWDFSVPVDVAGFTDFTITLEEV